LAVTTETALGVATPVTVGGEVVPPLPPVPPEPPVPPVAPLPPELPDATLVEADPPPHPTSTLTNAMAHRRHAHVLNDMRHSSSVDEAAQAGRGSESKRRA